MPVRIALSIDKMVIEIVGTKATALITETVAEIDIEHTTVTIYSTLIVVLFRLSLCIFFHTQLTFSPNIS